MKPRKSIWSEEDSKQLAAFVAAGGIAVLQVAEVRRANWACRLKIQRSGERIFWQNVRRLKGHYLASSRLGARQHPSIVPGVDIRVASVESNCCRLSGHITPISLRTGFPSLRALKRNSRPVPRWLTSDAATALQRS